MADYFPEYLFTFVDQLDEHPWLFAGLASVLVGLSGILPLLIIPLDSTDTFNDGRKYYPSIFTDMCFVIFRFAKSSFILVLRSRRACAMRVFIYFSRHH